MACGYAAAPGDLRAAARRRPASHGRVDLRRRPGADADHLAQDRLPNRQRPGRHGRGGPSRPRDRQLPRRSQRRGRAPPPHLHPLRQGPRRPPRPSRRPASAALPARVLRLGGRGQLPRAVRRMRRTVLVAPGPIDEHTRSTMPKLNGTKTHENLKEAFAGESQANRRYLYFAQKADVEGYPDVAALFRSVAEGETGHAFGHFDYLAEVGDPVTGVAVGPTEDNLKSAIEGETYEYTEMYPGFAKTARDEGFDEIAEWLETLARAEKSHAGRFSQGLESLNS